jgi:hypothetical protein
MLPAEAGGCAALAAAEGEALAGTASRYRNWLLVEQPGRWGTDALLDSGLDPEVGAHLAREGDRLGIRVLLIKRRGRAEGPARRCYAAFTGRRERRLTRFDVGDPRELAELDLEGLADRRWAGLGEPVPGPLSVVCTHAKHDACCARRGGPLARALADREDVWECTHVGGDRFAANLVCFPHGLFFGRVEPEAGLAVVEAYAAGRIVLPFFRGRSAYPPAAQVAEVALRRRLGLDGVDDLVLERHERQDGDRYRVRFLVPGGDSRVVEVRASHLAPRYLTCRASHPHRPRSFTVERVG